ncbi:hypothetical protein C9374_001583 [Naegleria lovaniensis]|uniref:Uncharacterized protein n=1 Tax=Naegleria lovaniensis TaxID=51637 RepID=A0AA88KN67_NAELO|nr:uncharacterized protein C9374_001583 [Naegleria lovaniensis]KAG2387251.1 hypothetical protein C9374_001583 [Naegleria lovaniensis]
MMQLEAVKLLDEEPLCNTQITLHDFIRIGSESYDAVIMNAFKNKMRKFKTKISFSMNFDPVAVIEVPNVFETRISHACNCIVALNVTEFICFDLNSHRKVHSFPAAFAFYFDIEENYDGKGSDALIYGGDRGVFKYDLNKIMNGEDLNNIWNQPEIHSMGMVCSPHNDVLSKNVLYVCSYDTCISALKSLTGEVLYRIQHFENTTGYYFEHTPVCFSDIDVNDTDTELFVSATKSKRIYNFHRIAHNNHQDDWQLIREFGGEYLTHPDGMVFDSVSRHVLVCEQQQQAKGCILVVFTEKGEFVKRVDVKGKDVKRHASPTGLCLDERTGLLYVVDCANFLIQIFK